MLKGNPLPPILSISSHKSYVSFKELNTSRTDHTHPENTHSNTDERGALHVLGKAGTPMNRPVFHSRRSVLVKTNMRPEDDIATLSTALSTRCPLVQETSTNDFQRSRTMYTTNATLVDRKKRSDVRADKMDDHKRRSNRRSKDNESSLNRGGNHYFPPGAVIKRTDDNIVLPNMFPKILHVDREGPCPTQLYTQTKLSYTEKISGSVQLHHCVRRKSRPQMEHLRILSRSTGASAGDSLDSVMSSNKMTIEGRVLDKSGRERPASGLSPLFKFDYFDDHEGLSVPPNSEIGPSRT